MKAKSGDRGFCSFAEVPITLKAEDVQKFFGLSRSAAYRLFHEPGFPVIRVGKAIRVPKEKLLIWMEEQTVNNSPKENPTIVGIGNSFAG